MNQQPLHMEEQACSELPDCPKPATVGSWGAWSACAQTCYPEGQPIPQIERDRSCTEAILSTDETLNAEVATCNQLGEVKMYKNCNIGTCPGMKPSWCKKKCDRIYKSQNWVIDLCNMWWIVHCNCCVTCVYCVKSLELPCLALIMQLQFGATGALIFV